MDTSLSKLREIVKDREACVLQTMGLQRVRHDLVTEQQQRWNEIIRVGPYPIWLVSLEEEEIGMQKEDHMGRGSIYKPRTEVSGETKPDLGLPHLEL